jgi:type I restriction enzyme S subunit
MKDEWQRKSLGDVCDLDRCQGIYMGLPYVGLEHIESCTGRFLGSIQPARVKSSTFKFSPEHVLYGRLRPYLNKVMLPDFVGHCSTEIFPIRPHHELQREFLRYWFSRDATVHEIDATCTGARMPRADMKAVLSFDFLLPPLPEQRRIVGVLDEAFAGIATAKAIAEKNLQNARALFESHLQAVFAERGDEWMEKALSDLCDIKHGFAFRSRFFTDRGDYVMLTPGNFYETGGYRDRREKQKFYCGDIPPGFVLKKGDLLVAMTEQAAGLLGSPILIPSSTRFLHNQRLGLVTKKPGIPWTNEFFFHVFNTRRVRTEIHDSASGVKVRHTSPQKIGKILVSFPAAVSEQRAIVSKLASIRNETRRLESLYQRKLTALDELKKSMLHQAFTGQL